MATIFDVAKEAGVSKSTVSRVVNGDPAVKPATREAVETAIRKLNYAPSYFAQGIRTGQTKTIALLVPEYTNMFYGEMFNGVEDVAFEHGYMVLVGNTGNTPSEKEYIQQLLNRRIDGIVYNTYHTGGESIEYLKKLSRKMPIVFMDEAIGKAEKVSSVYTDGFQSTKRAVEYLAGRGCRKIGYIRNMDSVQATEYRFEGYKQGLKELGLPMEEVYIYQCPVQKQANYIKAGMEAGSYFADLKERPDAILAAIDLLAIGCVSRMIDRGISVPEEISVIGYDNIDLGEVMRPAVTTIAQPTREMGRIAARIIMEQLKSQEIKCQKKVFDGKLIIRQTTR